MAKRPQNTKKAFLKCHVCGAAMARRVSDMPFKTGAKAVIVVKDLPVWECSACREYLLDDAVMKGVEAMLRAADKQAELEIVRYAA